MNAHAEIGPAQTLKFRAQSLLAYVLEPVQPLDRMVLRRSTPGSPALQLSLSPGPVILDMAALAISLKEYRELLSGLARRHIRVMAAENVGRGLVGPHLPPVVYRGTDDRRAEPQEDADGARGHAGAARKTRPGDAIKPRPKRPSR